MHGVTAHIADDVLGIVQPVQFRVALGQPGTGDGVLQRLGLVETAHVAEGGSGFVEGSLLKLCLTHQKPGLPDKGVVLLAAQPLTVFGCLAARFVPVGLGLDTMLLDGLLHFFDGTVELAFANLAALLIADRVEGQQFGVVVLVALFLFQRTVDEGL